MRVCMTFLGVLDIRLTVKFFDFIFLNGQIGANEREFLGVCSYTTVLVNIDYLLFIHSPFYTGIAGKKMCAQCI